MSSIFTPHLPWPITLHALFLLCFGLNTLFHPFSPAPSPRTHPNNSMVGILALGIALGYLLTAYVPVSQNTFLYASVPARMLLAALAGVKLVLQREEMGVQARRGMVMVLVYDGLGGLGLGWWLGRWDGRIPGY
ncbi:hypothetical protein K402DRAFT_398485 [Aulographum hederae CBS 113979]|uniref:Uncharacterized protein n=1 Tax=Aulographum hederae CBS 113979 TaxID=1176131 RepID=A0A6G1GL10_9PEZI|nr:hypothetical protein K402DRAFT_398485 [Aulographum hederae CBS 113979]